MQQANQHVEKENISHSLGLHYKWEATCSSEAEKEPGCVLLGSSSAQLPRMVGPSQILARTKKRVVSHQVFHTERGCDGQ